MGQDTACRSFQYPDEEPALDAYCARVLGFSCGSPEDPVAAVGSEPAFFTGKRSCSSTGFPDDSEEDPFAGNENFCSGMLVLTGASGVGKSTFVRRFFNEGPGRNVSFSGYLTVRHITRDRRHVEYVHVPPEKVTDGRPLTVVHETVESFPGNGFLTIENGAARFDVERFKAVVLPVLEGASDVIVLDEIGGEELLDNVLFFRLSAWIDERKKPIFMVFKQDRTFERLMKFSDLPYEDIRRLRSRRRMLLSGAQVKLAELVRGRTSKNGERETLCH